MSTDPIVTVSPIKGKYFPFDRSIIADDLSGLESRISPTKMASVIRSRGYISYEFTGAEFAEGSTATARGFRATSFGPGFAQNTSPSNGWVSGGDFRWLNFITGKVGGMTLGTPTNAGFNIGGDSSLETASIRDWYIWGARKFWLHHPFGRVAKGRNNQEAMHYQPDAYYSAKHGCTCPFTGILGNTPMPWLTDDVVDGVTQGFVPLFKALITGSQGDLSNDVWERLTGIGGGEEWYDPGDPIEVVVYNGTINQETFRKWRRWFETSAPITNQVVFGATGETEGMPANQYARYRLEASLEPFKQARMRLAFDALPAAPGPVNGLNACPTSAFIGATAYEGQLYTPAGQSYGAADVGWWKFFSEYVLGNWEKKDIFMEAHPDTIPGIGQVGFTMNPYQKIGGLNICASDEYTRQGFGGTSSSPPFAPTNSRAHYLGEHGAVEFVRSPGWAQAPHVGKFVGGITFHDGRYWFLRGLEEQTVIQGSLPDINFAAGNRYLRAIASFPFEVYQGACIWGSHLYADHFIRYQEQENCQTTIAQDLTSPGVLILSHTLRRIDEPRMTTIRNQTGITNDFSRAYPTLLDYAEFVADRYSFYREMGVTGFNDHGISHPSSLTNISNIVDRTGTAAALNERLEGLSHVLYLDPTEYDAFAGTGLQGRKNGGFYIPTPTNDLQDSIFQSWLDTKIKSWHRTFGKYPKYICWLMTEYSGKADNTLTQLEMERYLFFANTIPLSTTETSTAYNNKEQYFTRTPRVDLLSGPGTETLANVGFCGTPGCGSAGGAQSSIWTEVRDILVSLLQKTKTWRTTRGLDAKIGIYRFPHLPEEAYAVYGLSGTNAVKVTSAGWNARVFPKQDFTLTNGRLLGGQAGWHTEAETESLKSRIRLEYRKRLEPIVKECEFLSPDISCKTPNDMASDPNLPMLKEWGKEVINLAFNMKTIGAWNPQSGFLGDGSLPALTGGKIIPAIEIGYRGTPVSGITVGDPLTIADGSLFDYDKMDYTLVDWIRDDYLRPVRGVSRKVDGISLKKRYFERAFGAMRANSSTYAGRTADRDWVLKWLQASGGSGLSGATVNWTNATDVATKMNRFFDIQRSVSKNLLYRFDYGQPRIDIVDPFKHTVFAVGWNAGYSGSYPTTLEGMAITDVHPLIWVGWTAGTNGIIRDPGDTAGPSTQLFNETISRLNKVPEGRRVLLPYYWHQDPISDQTLQVNHYAQTSDGATYTGTLPLRTHELPGPVKLITPWAYQQTSDAKQSFQAFLNQCIATGAVFDYIADDGESWTNPTVGSNSNVFPAPFAPFGPTGMPARLELTGGKDHVFAFASWLKEPDNRMVPTYMKDSRVNTLVNPYTGLTFGAAVANKYKELLSNSTFFQNNGTLIESSDARAALSGVGSSAAFIMDYYTREGATGISAATGPASVTQLAPPIIDSVTEYIDNPARNATTPWRNPWEIRTDTTPNGRVSRYTAWLANRSAVEDLVMGDLYKRMWIDTIRGSTSETHRKVKYGHYDVYPLGVTEGAFLMDYNGHTPIHSDFSHIGATPVLYGEVGDTLRRAKYSTQPTDDYFKHSFILSFHKHPELITPFNDTAKTAFFTDQAGDIPARSYIALAKEVGILRGMLRTNPNAWKNLSPWIWNPFDLGWIGVEITSFRADKQSPALNVFDRCDIGYWNELLYHCLLSGTEHFNYFNPGANIDVTPSKVPGEIGEGGFTAGLTFMQGVLNEWKTISEGYRVQPCSNASGNPSALVDRLDISAAGGNHTGATGTVVSGAVILKNNSGKISDTVLGGTDDKTYVWRISAAPQGTNLFLQGGFTAELPKQINLVTGELSYGMTAAMSGATSGRFFEFTIGGGTLSYTSGTHTLLSTVLGIPNSGGDLHHTSQTIPSNNLTQPFVLGDGRRTTLTFNGRQTSTVAPFDPQMFNATPVSGSRGGLTIVGFFDLAKSNGLHGTNGNLLGIETAVAFVSFGGSVWQTVVAFKNPTTGQYRTYKNVLLEQVGGVFINGSFVDRTLKIDVNEDGSEAQFFVDGRLVDTVTAASIASDGVALGGMPVGQFRGNGTWAGAGVRDISLSETATTATSIQTLLCNSMSTSILPKTTDAQVTVSRRGAWIKSRRSSLMPQYRISDLNAQLPEGHLRNGGGFPATNPDEIFSGDPAPIADTSDLTVTGDLRAIAAWKEDPIPFYQTPPSGTVTVMAFHPSGIQKVEASLNGGQIATRTGSEGIPYQEFTFILPPLSGGSGSFVNLPKTPAGVSYGGMHQIRAKVFPFSGKPRVLGGLPEESSQYYSPLVSPGDPTPRKRETNETSFFLMNVSATDPKLTKLCTVNPEASDNFPTSFPPIYRSIREAIIWELGNGSGSCGSAKNKDFLIIQTVAGGQTQPLTFPSVGDNNDLGGIPSRLSVSFTNPENKTLIINEMDDTATRGMTFVANRVSGSDNSQTSFNNLTLGRIADTWANTSQVFSSVLPDAAKAYGISSGDQLIYRLNKNPLTTYNGTVTTAPGSANPNWQFGGTGSVWTGIVEGARAGGFSEIGRVKINGLPNARYIIDRGSLPNFFTENSTQAIRFENVEFISSLLPAFDPIDFVRNGNVSYVNCVINAITGGLQHGFGFSRYVSGCTAVGVRGRVFSNAALVLSSSATGSSKLDKTNPSFFGRFVDGISGDARSKKNSIYKDVTCFGDFTDCISMGRNETAPTLTDKHKIGHYDLLYSNIQMGGTIGIADRIEGNVNNVHFVGVSMPNAMILSPEYKSALISGSLKKQKFYVDAGSRMRMVMNEGPTSGNQIALQGDDFIQNYRTGFGIQMGNPESPSNDAIVSIKPKRPGGIAVKIKGIPTKYDVLGALSSGNAAGNTWTPIFTKTHPTTGIRTFGLEMGGGFGPTAQGFTANGLTFACWSRNSFDAVPLSPRLCWVYSTNVFWPAVPGVTASSWVPNDRYTYEFGVSGIAQPTIFPFVSANLHTFFNSNSMTDSVLPDANASVHWMMLRNRSAPTDTWSNNPFSQDIAANPSNLNFPVGASAHWLLNGQSVANSTSWMAPNRTFDINGTGSVNPGRIQIARLGTNGEATALATALNSNSNPALGGITITDQFGNLFRIDGGKGAFTTSTVFVNVNANQIEYASGSVVGTTWASAGVIGAFPREWIYNGDATAQYAPIKLEINLANTSVRVPI
jgi:hypothetical protein